MKFRRLIWNYLKDRNRVCSARTFPNYSSYCRGRWYDCKNHARVYVKRRDQYYYAPRAGRLYICQVHWNSHKPSREMCTTYVIGPVPSRVFMEPAAGKIKVRRVSR